MHTFHLFVIYYCNLVLNKKSEKTKEIKKELSHKMVQNELQRYTYCLLRFFKTPDMYVIKILNMFSKQMSQY